MENQFILLAVGAIFGFASAAIIEVIRHKFERERLGNERNKNSAQARGKGVRDFLAPPSKKPAWLRLVQTRVVAPFFQKERTVDRRATSLQTLSTNDDTQETDMETIEKFLLVPTQVIGRQKDCEIVLSDSAVSRLHALVRYEEGNFVIYDLGSKSGTYVDGIEVNKDGTILYHGDRLMLGESIFIFEGSKARNQRRKNMTTTRTLVSGKSTSKSGKQKIDRAASTEQEQ